MNSHKSNSQGTTSLILGILAIITGFVPGLGLLLAILAIYFASKQRKIENTTASKVGNVLGWIVTGLYIFGIVIVLLVMSFTNSVNTSTSTANEINSASNNAVPVVQQTQTKCVNECAVGTCSGKAYVGCERASTGCYVKKTSRKVIGQCGVECIVNSDCSSNVCDSSNNVCLSFNISKTPLELTHDNIKYKIRKQGTAYSIGENEYFQTEADGKFYILYVEATNVGKEPITIAGGNIRLIDTQNREFEPESMILGASNIFPWYDSINPGIMKYGQVIYDVPRDFQIKQIKLGSEYSLDVTKTKSIPLVD